LGAWAAKGYSISPVDSALDSVVISAYDSAPLIADTLTNVLAQDYPALGVIVVADGTAALAR
jgi:cellulose synthase/poly-beta-1,6-N-acetylglucosamine synthase-like glycosyltransferase